MGRNVLNRLLFMVMWLLMFVVIVVSVVVRITNPDLTETQFFLEYWWFWIVVGALLVWMGILGRYEVTDG